MSNGASHLVLRSPREYLQQCRRTFESYHRRMMIRERSSRALFALVALVAFLGASAGDAWAVDPCPHHDVLAVSGVDSPTGHDQHHHGQQANQAERDDSGGSGQHPEHGPCTCVGNCGLGSSPPLSAQADATLVPVGDTPTPATRIPETDRVRHGDRTWSPYFPNAPPLSL